MEQAEFARMVARLERESAASPGAYKARVAALALLGFLIIGLIVGFAALGLLLLVGVAVAVVVTGGKALILLFKLGKLLVLLAIPLWLLVRSSVSALLTRLPAPEGIEIQRLQAPPLFAALEDMRARMKGPRFHHVLVVDSLNAAVAQRPLFGLMGWPRNYLILGLPLLEAMTAQEATAVVAHEYGHLAGSHGHFGAFIYRLRLTWGTVQQLSLQWQGWAGRPLRRVVQWYAPYFNAYTFVLARTNEYLADAASVDLVGAEATASALKRVNITAPRYEKFVQQTFRSTRDTAQPPDDVALRWAHDLREPGVDGRDWLDAALKEKSAVSDTHPALRDRLRALPGQAALESALPAPLAESSAAATWFGAGLDKLRETLQAQWRERVAAAWAERHAAQRQGLARLAELDAMAEPGVDAQVERLRLRVELHPEDDHLEALAAFNAAHAGLAMTLYLEGLQRLERHDDAGLELLRRALAADPDATKPACGHAYAYQKARGDDEQAEVWADRWKRRHALEQAGQGEGVRR